MPAYKIIEISFVISLYLYSHYPHDCSAKSRKK